ncbi:tetratricopeptide repeat protein [Pedobacter africanus]|uniref:TPR repeat-containing protein n=1 Tax=Pedobacter africanus TaxID=151894 RepID=A0A1W1Z9K8_9SPHI|nr:tetratricopeptide repeat protein [Pedobacter africanus]SMC44891.1 TPR repeat-containing protein [Pedobacter africanus]
MKKTYFFTLLILFVGQVALSQTKPIKDLYWDYSQMRMDPATRTQAKDKALALLARSTELTEKQLANVNFHLGRIYEEIKEPDKAVPHYEQAIKLAPAYYVTYRALGFIYLKKCDSIGRTVTEAAKAKNAKLHAERFSAYKNEVSKTLPYFEKSQACDPDERTLAMITNLYNSIKNPQALLTLDERLKKLGGECASLLDDE